MSIINSYFFYGIVSEEHEQLLDYKLELGHPTTVNLGIEGWNGYGLYTTFI